MELQFQAATREITEQVGKREGMPTIWILFKPNKILRH